MKKLSMPPKAKAEPSKIMISLRLPPDLHEKIKACAAQKGGIKPSALILMAVAEYLERNLKA